MQGFIDLSMTISTPLKWIQNTLGWMGRYTSALQSALPWDPPRWPGTVMPVSTESPKFLTHGVFELPPSALAGAKRELDSLSVKPGPVRVCAIHGSSKPHAPHMYACHIVSPSGTPCESRELRGWTKQTEAASAVPVVVRLTDPVEVPEAALLQCRFCGTLDGRSVDEVVSARNHLIEFGIPPLKADCGAPLGPGTPRELREWVDGFENLARAAVAALVSHC